MAANQTSPDPQHSFEELMQQLGFLLERRRLLDDLAHKQQMPRQDLVESLAHRQAAAQIENLLRRLHPADIARLLEALPPEDRLLIWDLSPSAIGGEVLLEVSEAVRESIIDHISREELVAAASQLDSDEIADLAPGLPEEVMQSLLESLDVQNRERLQTALAHAPDSVGAMMDFGIIKVRPDISLEVVNRYLRRLGELPDQTDALMVVDRSDRLQGVLPVARLLCRDPAERVAEVMIRDAPRFAPEDRAGAAATAFERYDLVMSPVVDQGGRLLGRVTVDAVIDHIREESGQAALNRAGLRAEEDLFSSIWKATQNRWPWLAVNLVTAVLASRIIGLFEGTIEQLVALAALMPIIAGIGGNTGNQTNAIIIRGLALGLISPARHRRLIGKELGISLLNGLMWGAVVGLVAYGLYGSPSLGLIMFSAMVLQLLLAAAAGLAIPLLMNRFGHDPAIGSSVLLTATTDCGGFFIFLGLATLFLI